MTTPKPLPKKSLGITKNRIYLLNECKQEIKQKINRFKKPLNSSFHNDERNLFKSLLNGTNTSSDGIEMVNSGGRKDQPNWIAFYDNILRSIKEIKIAEKEIIQLSSERIKMQFGNPQKLDRRIHELTVQATELIHRCEADLGKIDEKSGNNKSESENDKKIRLNIQKSLATQIQDVTNSLRVNQKKLFDYVKKYNSIEGGEFLRLSEEKMLEMKDSEIEENKNELELMEELAQERDEEINKLVETINELTRIFKQMNQLVIDQGTLLDRIDFNIEDTLVQTRKGNEQLVKANEYQKSNRGTYCIAILSVLIFFFLLILIIKYTH